MSEETRRNRRSQRGEKQTDKKKKPLAIRVLLITLGVLVACAIGVFAYTANLVSAMKYDPNAQGNYTPEPEDELLDPSLPDIGDEEIDSSLSGKAAPIEQGKNTFNIVLIGLDTRDPKRFSGSRSDVMMLLSVDTEKKTMKLTSFMRDILVSIDGHDKNRLNTAFVFNGPEGTLQALKDNFGVQADKFAIINFWALSDVIDALGGVDIDVKSAEIKNMNKSIRELNELATGGKKAPEIKNAGLQHLNGRQAVGYMRIRKVGNGDFERTQRQRTVLNKLTAQMSDLSLDKAISLANVLPKYVRTNMSQAEIIEMATKLYDMRGTKVQEMRIPMDKTFKYGNYKKMSILLIDFQKNRDALKDFLTK